MNFYIVELKGKTQATLVSLSYSAADVCAEFPDERHVVVRAPVSTDDWICVAEFWNEEKLAGGPASELLDSQVFRALSHGQHWLANRRRKEAAADGH